MMNNWTPEAQEFLEGYLHQVGALARQRGEDADDVKAGLRDHITAKLEESAGSVVSLDVLQRVLAEVGRPEQVVSEEFVGIKTATIAGEEGSPVQRKGQNNGDGWRAKMAKCPHCDNPIGLDATVSGRSNEVRRDVKGVIKKEIMYSCPHCERVLGFGSFFGGLLTGRP